MVGLAVNRSPGQADLPGAVQVPDRSIRLRVKIERSGEWIVFAGQGQPLRNVGVPDFHAGPNRRRVRKQVPWRVPAPAHRAGELDRRLSLRQSSSAHRKRSRAVIRVRGQTVEMNIARRLRRRWRWAERNNIEVRRLQMPFEIRGREVPRHRPMKLRLPMKLRRNRRWLSRRSDAERRQHRIEFRHVARHQAGGQLCRPRHRINTEAARDLNLRRRRMDIEDVHNDGTASVHVLSLDHSIDRHFVRTRWMRGLEGYVYRTRHVFRAARPVDVRRPRCRSIKSETPEVRRSDRIKERIESEPRQMSTDASLLLRRLRPCGVAGWRGPVGPGCLCLPVDDSHFPRDHAARCQPRMNSRQRNQVLRHVRHRIRRNPGDVYGAGAIRPTADARRPIDNKLCARAVAARLQLGRPGIQPRQPRECANLQRIDRPFHPQLPAWSGEVIDRAAGPQHCLLTLSRRPALQCE